MTIEIDYNPSPKDSFFISVSLNEKEALSFDYTTKGCRIIKQVLIQKEKHNIDSLKKGKPDS